MFILLAASLIPPFYLMWRVYQIDKIEILVRDAVFVQHTIQL